MIRHEDFLIVPSDETVIWRYMDLPKLLMVLEDKALYFSLVKELGDSWEAVLPQRLTDSIAQYWAPAVSGDFVNVMKTFSEVAGVNCWYRGESESIAMWNLYTSKPYGVAIKSTVGRLKDCFHATSQDILLGSILYEDHRLPAERYLSPDQINAVMPLLQKRPCYRHECELRAITLFQPDGTPEHAQQIEPLPERGISVEVDLSILIESITLGPGFYAHSLLVSALARAHIIPPILESDVHNPPARMS